MSLYLLLATDDPGSAAALLAHAPTSVSNLTRSVEDLGGTVLTLVTTSGRFSLVALIDLPDNYAATAIGLVHQAFGRSVELIPAVAMNEFDRVLDDVGKIRIGLTPPENPEP